MKLCSPQQAKGDSSYVKKREKAGCLTVSDSAYHVGEIHRLVALQNRPSVRFFPFLWEINGEHEQFSLCKESMYKSL